jgi:polar amino acid transport system permease protein
VTKDERGTASLFVVGRSSFVKIKEDKVIRVQQAGRSTLIYLSQPSVWRDFRWWLLIIVIFILLMSYQIATSEHYNRAFQFIWPGIRITLTTTLYGFLAAMALGLLAGLGRISQNFVARTLAMTYIEFIRGVPVLVLIVTIAFVVVPAVADLLNLNIRGISNQMRAVIALALIYGAFLAEVFRAGIESIPHGQMEAARSLGMNPFQAMRYIILPQAVRNILPALGNDFIAMLKDSSLVSVLAVRDITQLSRLYTGSTFRYNETYLVLTFLYLTMTILLSLLLQWYQRWLRRDS